MDLIIIRYIRTCLFDTLLEEKKTESYILGVWFGYLGIIKMILALCPYILYMGKIACTLYSLLIEGKVV